MGLITQQQDAPVGLLVSRRPATGHQCLQFLPLLRTQLDPVSLHLHPLLTRPNPLRPMLGRIHLVSTQFKNVGLLGSVDISLQWRYVEHQTITRTVGQDSRFLAWLHWRVRRPGSGLPTFCRGRLMGQPLWGSMATAASQNTGTGTPSTNDSPVGLTKASGHKCINIAATTRIWNT